MVKEEIMNEVKKESNLVPLHFTMSESQYLKLKKLKQEGYCKIMYILRYATFYVIYSNEKNIRAYKDLEFKTKTGKHYKVDLPINVYNKMKEKSDMSGLSMSKLIRIGLNDVLSFL